jgi:alpha-mannosidase
MRVDPPGLLVSAVKRSISGDDAVIRLCNLFDNEVEAQLTFFRPVLSARTTNLAEEISDGSSRDLARNLSTNVHTVLRKGEIQTLSLRFGGEKNAAR